MKLPLALTLAAAGLALSTAYTASAQPNTPAAPRAERGAPRVHVFRGGPGAHFNLGNADANNDGWLSRAEAQAQADRVFDQLDTNDDRKLDQADRPEPGDHHFEFSGGPGGDGDIVIERGGPGSRTVIIRRGDDDDDVDVRTDGDNTRNVERHVTIIRNGQVIESDDDDDSRPRAPRPPRAPRAPHAPMFMMLYANSDEADRNGDGALSQDEFRAQQMRFFDASDANGDGKIRLPRPPEPPVAPRAPTPPTPPRN